MLQSRRYSLNRLTLVSQRGLFRPLRRPHRAAEGEFDIVISLYHDQGHIAAKTLDFRRTVSMNLGLPFLRTSLDHGTAFDIASKGIANPVSMVGAIKTAARYGKDYRGRYAKLR
jgi:4-phospho-D-threonate 3-dehydrogenase / 4-phospho-D-erythronate 3-dehydrogenase